MNKLHKLQGNHDGMVEALRDAYDELPKELKGIHIAEAIRVLVRRNEWLREAVVCCLKSHPDPETGGMPDDDQKCNYCDRPIDSGHKPYCPAFKALKMLDEIDAAIPPPPKGAPDE